MKKWRSLTKHLTISYCGMHLADFHATVVQQSNLLIIIVVIVIIVVVVIHLSPPLLFLFVPLLFLARLLVLAFFLFCWIHTGSNIYHTMFCNQKEFYFVSMIRSKILFSDWLQSVIRRTSDSVWIQHLSHIHKLYPYIH